jgi:hypothetical protein
MTYGDVYMKNISHQTSCINLLHGWSIQYSFYLRTILKTKNYYFIISAIKLELKILELDITRGTVNALTK